MSRCLMLLFALAVMLGWGVKVPFAQAADPIEKSDRAVAEADVARIDVYGKGGEKSHFALSITPNIELPTPQGHEVVVLFDTSASQTGAFRSKAIDTLKQFFANLKTRTEVKLFAVDLAAVPLTDKFVAADSEVIGKAMETLKRLAPLGATDVVAAFETAAQSFDVKSNKERSVVYIGDGQSGAHFVDSETLKQLIKPLVERHIAVTSYAVGPRIDSSLLAAIANQTGGLLAVDGDGPTVKQVAAFLASAIDATVIWPTNISLPKQFASVYPKQVPPLRSDRDTVLIGKLEKDGSAKTIDVAISGKSCGKDVRLAWTVPVGDSNEDFAFLTELVDSAKGNDGVGLATVGTAGLNESRRLMNVAVEEISKLGSQAVATGNIDTAEQLANEALRRDPNDPTARTVKKAVQKQRAAHVSAKAAIPAGETPVEVRTQKTSKGILKLEKLRNDQAPTPDAEFPQDEVAPGDPELLESVETNTTVIRELIEREVQNAITNARDQMASEPENVQQNLKLELDKVLRAPELSAELRAQLRDQIESTLQEASRRATEFQARDQEAQAAISARNERQRLVLAIERDQEKVKQLMDRFDALMDEGRYELAEETAGEVADIKPDSTIAVSAVVNARQARNYTKAHELRILRQRGVVDTLYQVELAHIPFPDDEPIIYPAAPVWEELTLRRKKFASVDLKKTGPAEERIKQALEDSTVMEFVETPLSDVVDYLKDYHKIEIQLDTKALEDAGAGSDTPITKNLKGISLRSALRLMLGGLDLTYVIKDEVLLITTPEKASSELVTKVYPVADLVLPIRQTGFQGGFGGMGGMQGGMGGMGGGGGGMGGMGGMGGGGMGGFGGGGMGGGGGFFNVPDNVKTEVPKAAVAIKDDLKLKSNTIAPPAASAKLGKGSVKVTAIELKLVPGSDFQAAWYDYLTKNEGTSDAQIRETARVLMKARNFSSCTAMIQASLATGHTQPWMYEALGLALIASGSNKADIERALMSAVDFAESPEELMYAAQYMARNGLEKRALSIFRQVSAADPLRTEPLQYGLQLASRVNDLDAQKWASLGVLKQAWPNDKRELEQQANRVARSVIEQLKAEKRTNEATEFEAALAQALIRDVRVKVSWTGDADVDVLVEEPSGTVSSFRNPRTTAGGVMLGDTASRGVASKDGMSEVYVCPEAFSGTYKMQLRRVWGKLTAGKVTVELTTNFGTRAMQYEKQQIPLGEQDAFVVFDVLKGRRSEPIGKHLLANAAADQLAVNRAVLAQQLNSMGGNAGANFALSRAALDGQFPIVRGAVGFQPVIIALPSGANFSATGVISADRRYVRITVLPLFSQIGQVTTFNIGSGATTVTPAPPPGGGGVNPPPPNPPANGNG
jgi:hypothetical protein